MKLYEIVLRKLGWWKDPPPEVQEKKVYNPEEARVGSTVSLDILDHRDVIYTVKEIREADVSMGDRRHKFTDYVLFAWLGEEEHWCRLRLVPEPNPDLSTHRVLLLTMLEEMTYNEDFHAILKDESGKFNVEEPGRVDEYSRVGGVKTPYIATITMMQDEDNSGRVDAHEVKHEKIEFWDYSRLALDKEEFIFVEMNSDNGWFQIWHGVQINPQSVSVYSTKEKQ
jgi:hypothetical protein